MRPPVLLLAVGLVVATSSMTAPSSSYAVTVLPGFSSSVRPIDDALKARMVHSWHPGCPVSRARLRYVRVSFVGFGGAARQGELVVHERVAADVISVFRTLYEDRFPIRRMRLVDDYHGNDDESMAANNTSAFNCRRSTGSASWSEHSYGRAIDVNPVQNPYVRGTTIEPPAGERYLDRSRVRTGMVTRAVRDAFAGIGWSWGGAWSSSKDYQHYSATGR